MITENCESRTPMGKAPRWFLAGYLLAFSILAVLAIVSLWAPESSLQLGKPPAPACDQAAGPKVTSVFPDRLALGSTFSDLQIVGCGFSPATQVRFNGTQRAVLYSDSSHLRSEVTGIDVAAVGSIAISVYKDGADIGSGVLVIVPMKVDWKFLWFQPLPISYELQILLLVLAMGAFGSGVYSLKSLANYEGDGALFTSWFKFYLIQPFEGAGIAFLLYLVIRGGLLAGTNGDAKVLSQFGICAISGLAGAFSDTAFLKLREVFLTLFKPKDDRLGKLTMKVTTVSLPDAIVGRYYSHTLHAQGGAAHFTWSVFPSLPGGLFLNGNTGTISGTPAKILERTTFTFTAMDSAKPSQVAASSLAFEVKLESL